MLRHHTVTRRPQKPVKAFRFGLGIALVAHSVFVVRVAERDIVRAPVNGRFDFLSHRSILVDPRSGQLMIATVFIGSPNGVANHFFDDRPSATVESDFLTDLERGRNSVERVDLTANEGRYGFLSHDGILAEICEKRKLSFHLFALAIAPSKVAQTADLVKEIGGEHLTVKPIMALTSESTSAGDD